jgi:hypothetical protein
MPLPNPPYVVIQSGFQNPTTGFAAGSQFSWYNEGGNACTVTIQGNWCTAPSPNPIPGGQSATSTVQLSTTTGSYYYTSPCYQANQPVRVIGGHPMPTKK